MTDLLPPDPDDDLTGFKPRAIRDDAEMDITPMIDMVFLLLIYFLVCSSMVKDEVKLPHALYGTAVSDKQSLTLYVRDQEGRDPLVWQEGVSPFPTDPDRQAAAITQAVREAKDGGRTNVLVKIDRTLRQKQLEAVRRAISEVEGVSLFMAVDDRKK